MSQVIAATRLAEFSQVVFALWEKCYSLKPDEFVDFMFGATKRLLPYDAGYWAGGRNTDTRQVKPVVHFAYGHRMPEDAIQRMAAAGMDNHPHMMQCFHNLGRSHTFSGDNPELTEQQRHVLISLGMRQLLIQYFPDPTSRLIRAFSVYRDSDLGFSGEDRLLHEALTPHIHATYRTAMIASHAGPGHCRGGIALTDGQGSIHFADPLFAELIQLEWPDWLGPDLPAALQAVFAPDRDRHVGPALVVQRLPTGKLFSIEVRRRCALDDLSEREKEVARRFAKGEDYKTVARAVGIAPATARNHLANCYRKLGISDKTELVELMQRI